MNETENPVIDEITENVEDQTTEETDQEEVEFTDTSDDENNLSEEAEKLYTEVEFNDKVNDKVNDLLAKKIAMKERKIRKEYDKKYGRAERIIKAGLGTDDFNKAIDDLEKFYEEKGVQIPKQSRLNDEEEAVLADHDAQLIIDSGYEDIVSETDRLAKLGKDNLDKREQRIFLKLAEARTNIEEEKQLAKLGIKKEKLSDDFYEFANNLNPSMSLLEKYEMYLKYQPKKQIETIGSMKSGQEKSVKEFYTEEEISKLSLDDLDDPQVWEAVRKSMTTKK